MDKQIVVHPYNGTLLKDKRNKISSHENNGRNLSAYCCVKEAESEKATHCYTTFYKR